MEFERDKPVSDNERRLAEAKKLTLEPLHTDIAPEPDSDAQTVARHLAGPAIENSEVDKEQNIPPVQPSKGILSTPQPAKKWNERKFFLILITITVAVMLLIAALAFGVGIVFLSR